MKAGIRKGKTLADLLEQHKELDRTGIRFIRGSNKEEFLSYAGLYELAFKGLSLLQKNGLRPGDELVFQIDDQRDFIIVFWACILGGILPVPLSMAVKDDHKEKLLRIWPILKNPSLLSGQENLKRIEAYSQSNGYQEIFSGIATRVVKMEEIPDAFSTHSASAGIHGEPCPVTENDIALIQFSSGSTGNPKGVTLTHKNILTNIRSIGLAARYDHEDSLLSWMPLTHDMGLIGFHINPVYYGLNHYLIPTEVFVRKPAIWLEKASEHKATVLCSPNFGYSYTLKHCSRETSYPWDLRSVRIIYNGAEPISAELCLAFTDFLSPYGLRQEAICPVYGLAEASLAVSISGLEEKPLALKLDRHKMKIGDPLSAQVTDDHSVAVVNVGRPIQFCSVRITDRNNSPLPEQVIGLIQIRGDNVTTGYYNDDKATKAAFTGEGWLNTGDTGFLQQDHLFITGREKDILFKNGQNYYPHDIESLAVAFADIELNKIVVAGAFDPVAQQEEMLAFVFHRGSPEAFIPVARLLRETINVRTGLVFDKIIPVSHIPRTTSGKLQRYRLLQQYQAGELAGAEAAVRKKIINVAGFSPLSAASAQDPIRSSGETGDNESSGATGSSGDTESSGATESSRATGSSRATESSRDNESSGATGSSGDTESRILTIWRTILDDPAIDDSHRFFEVGGNSLKAAEAGMLLFREFHIDLPFDILYEKQTIKELALEITTRQEQQKDSLPIAAGPTPLPEDQGPLPVAPAQRRLYYAWELDKNSVAYNIPVSFFMKEEPDRERLRKAAEVLVQRHDSLRMSFYLGAHPSPGTFAAGPLLQVHDRVEIQVASGTVDPEDLDEKLRTLVRPFDLSTPPLFRMTVLKIREEKSLQIKEEKSLLFFDIHHIIADGLSVSLLLHELFVLYQGAALPVLPITYRDYADRENKRVLSEILPAHERFWLEEMKKEPALLECPLDFQRPAIFDTRGEKIAFSLSAGQARQLRQMAGAHSCTLHTLLLTVYRVLLFKYTHQENSVIGIAVSGRTRPDTRTLTGMFVNSLPVCNSLSGEDAFTALLEREKENLTGIFRHQEYPFDRLAEKASLNGGTGRNPLFDTMFLFQDMEGTDDRFTAAGWTRHFFDPGISKYDLSLEIFDHGQDRIDYYFEYASALFKRQTILNLALYFDRVITSVLKDPDILLKEISLLDSKDYHQTIRDFNATESPYPDLTVYQLFGQQVLQFPHRIALEHEGALFTYRQLDDMAARIDRLLLEQGSVKGGIIAILLPRSPGLISATLGVMRGGGAFLLIDPDLPRERISYMISHSRSRILLSDTAGQNGWSTPAGAEPLTVIDIYQTPRDRPGPPDTGRESAPSDLAYVLYTSGTTGNPKGVMIGHRSLTNYIHWASRQYIQEGSADFPLFTSVSFDLTITSLFVPLVTGNRIVIYEDRERQHLLDRIIAENKVDIIKLTPSHLKLVKDFALPEGGSRIRTFIIGGEALETHLAKDIALQFGKGVRLYNEYGPTEATVGCMIHLFDEKEEGTAVPIGVPAANTRIYVLDRYEEPVPIGVTGELYISGDGLARGYLFNEPLTAEKFLPDPYRDGEKMYRTGDLARRTDKNLLEYLGRSDSQVKINGYRIELSEIQLQLEARDDINQAIVLAVENPSRQKIIQVFYTHHPAPEPAAEVLRDYLASRLPYYMIPSRFIPLKKIPLTRHGKVDQQELLQAGEDQGRRQAGALAEDGHQLSGELPGNDLEELSLRIWKEVLGAGDLTVTHNFFQCGGDSIKAVQIASRLYAENAVVSVKEILTYQTIREICRHAETTIPSGKHYAQGPAEGKKAGSPAEAWFFEQRLKTPGCYNQAVLVKFKKEGSADLLARAFEKLIAHHDGLRLNYDPDSASLYYNNNHLQKAFLLEEMENPEEPEAAIRFDITRDLLFKAGYWPGAGAGTLMLVAHHLVIDGLSWRILLEDLYTAYRALEEGVTVRLPAKTCSLKDWVEELALYGSSALAQKDSSYWNQFGETPFSIPPESETNDWTVKNLAKISGHVTKEITTSLLRDGHKAYKADMQVLLSAGLTLALHQWTGKNEFVVEWENQGRQLDQVDCGRTIGWFTAMFPVRLYYSDAGISTQIKIAKENIRNIPRQGIGYGILKYMSGQTGPRRTEEPVFRFNYLGQFDSEFDNDLFDAAPLKTGVISAPENTMTAGIECNLLILHGQLRMECWYNHKAWPPARMKRFMDLFLSALATLAAHLGSGNEIHLTPSDFEGVSIGQKELDSLFE